MRKAIYPGSFDPVTLGHLDIIERSALLFDEVAVVVMRNDQKQGLFTVAERIRMLEESCLPLANVRVLAGSGLTVDYAHQIGATVIIRGLRAVMDYEYELQQSTINMTLAPDIETLFLMAKPEYSFLSSSAAKTVAANGGDLSPFVPAAVAKEMAKKLKDRR